MPPKKPAAKPVPKPGGKTSVGKSAVQTSKPGVKKVSSKPSVTGKKPTASTSQTKTVKETKPAEKKWTPQDEAAKKIQTSVRKFLAKKKLERKKKEKEDYEATMERLEREAFVKLVQMEQEQAEKERQKEEEERKRKREETKRKKRMLEGAFDGDIDEIKQVLKEAKEQDDRDGIGHDVIGENIRNRHQMNLVECEDANENTPLSEASSGGNVIVIKYLIERGADPNTKGQFGRSPLYRAAFAGHLEAVQCLLQFGADPRKYADDGQIPENVASHPSIVETLANWDISQTEKLLAKIEDEKERRKEEDRKRREVETENLEKQLEDAEKDYKSYQKNLCKCTQELNKRIYEHDQAASEGFERPELTIQAIHDAEGDFEIAKLDIENARDKVAKLKLKLRDKQLEGVAEADLDDLLPGLKVTVRELDDVLLRDVGNRIKESGKWPLIIDPSGQAATFLTYRDTNYFNTLNPIAMAADKVRLGLLGALRYGKPFVLDMMEVDMWESVIQRFNEIKPGLMDSVMDKTILKEEKFLPLVKDGDGEAYNKNFFTEDRLQRFSMFIISKNPFPSNVLLDNMYVLRIHIPT